MKPTCFSRFIVSGLLIFSSTLWAEDKGTDHRMPHVMTFGEMHIAIGQQQHQGRVLLQELVNREHFYAVGALTGLKGEITICDGKVLISTVSMGKPKPVNANLNKPQATLLVGAYVPEWSNHNVVNGVSSADFDEFVRKTAVRAGLDTTRPFVFRIDGEFENVRLHIINGACPVHASNHSLHIPKDSHPFEAAFSRIKGTVIGVYAKNATGKLTHPGTTTHKHLIFKDGASGIQLTGHLEKMGIGKDAVLKLPKW